MWMHEGRKKKEKKKKVNDGGGKGKDGEEYVGE